MYLDQNQSDFFLGNIPLRHQLMQKGLTKILFPKNIFNKTENSSCKYIGTV